MGRKSTRQSFTERNESHDFFLTLDTVRQRILKLIKSTIDSVGKLNDSSPQSNLSVLKDELETNWSEYIKAFEDHEAALIGSDSNEVTIITREYIDYHNKYVQSKVHLATLLASFPQTRFETREQHVQLSVQPNITSNFKMPPIHITPFDGDPIGWIEFKATCDSVLLDTVPHVHRLQCLKDALVGEPRALVGHVLPGEGSFQKAMRLLKDRYENKRAIVNEHLRRFYTIPFIGIVSFS